MTPRHLPNVLSFLRIGLVVPAIWLILSQRYVGALAIMLLAALTDGLDGYLARRFGWTSRLGAVVDPLADKLMLVGLYVTLAATGHLPWWLAGLVVLRDLTIMGGALAYHLFVEAVPMEPSTASKLNTGLQVLLLVLVLSMLSGGPVAPWLIEATTAAVAVGTIGTGVQYVVVWTRRARSRLCRRGNPE